jgi:autotransporter strand-loop-strand O-heptosyltransferase
MNIKVNYYPTQPILGDNPKISIFDNIENEYLVKFIDKKENNTIIEIYNNKGEKLFTEEFNPQNKVIFIKLDGYALGDNIAWIPYVEEFRKKYSATVICSTFWNDLFIDAYPEILFVKPNTQINNVYAQVYIGANEKNNFKYSPINSINNPLQKVASSILGLEHKEIKPKISNMLIKEKKHDFKYVTLSEFGSTKEKNWKYSWQPIVDYLSNYNYKVVVISKEKTKLINVIDKTGDLPIEDRVNDIYHAEFHLGVSTGLSWLSWGLGTHVVLLSDYTPYYHEFQTNITRIGTNVSNPVNYNYTEATPLKKVIENINKIIK